MCDDKVKEEEGVTRGPCNGALSPWLDGAPAERKRVNLSEIPYPLNWHLVREGVMGFASLG
jgi:hypothetical protein